MAKTVINAIHFLQELYLLHVHVPSANLLSKEVTYSPLNYLGTDGVIAKVIIVFKCLDLLCVSVISGLLDVFCTSC